MNSLDCIMKPASIAVIGASSKPHTIGSDIIKRLLEYGFQGNLYPVNPKGEMVEGMKCFTNVKEIPASVDMALIVINSKFVLQAIDDCYEKGVKGVVIISAGFKEAGTTGVELENQLKEKLKQYGMRCVGPNCLGVVNTAPSIQMDACFAETLPRRGNIGFVSQSGALGGGILNILKDLQLGFAQFISIGNQADVDAESAIEYWENDDDVEQILLYMEGITNAKRFRNVASRVSKKKPILVLKAGRSAAGASAASSHTGSLAGGDKAAAALLAQSGVIREFSLEDLFSNAKAFANCPIPKGNKVAIVTNSGGPGIMATDAICEAGMEMANLSEETKAQLRSFLPAAASVKNPVDMIASAPLEHYRKTMETVLKDPSVDMLIVIYLPFLGLKDIDVAQEVMRIKAENPDKPIVGVFMTTNEFFNKLSDMQTNVPFYMYAERAAMALDRLNRQRIWQERPVGNYPTFDVKKNVVQDIFDRVLSENRTELTTRESIDVLDAYGIRVCKAGFAKDEAEAVAIANQIGYPVVMKMSSTTISHKTDVGGVRVGIESAEQLQEQYQDLIQKLKDRNCLDGLEGVIIQEMVKGKREMVCGVATDPLYGRMIMFGLGGIFVEALEDVTFRMAPLSDVDATDMVHSVDAYKLLAGARGLVPAQVNEIEKSLLKLSQLVEDFPSIEELDINPLIISDKNGEPVAVDGRIKIVAK